MPAGGPWVQYNSAEEYDRAGTIDLGGDTLKLALFTSGGNAGTLTHEEFGDLSGEHADENGYSAGGATLTGVTVSRTGRTWRLTCSPVEWTASGGSIAAVRAVLYKDGSADGVTDPLIATCLLSPAGTTVTVTAGNPLRIVMNALGILQSTGTPTS